MRSKSARRKAQRQREKRRQRMLLETLSDDELGRKFWPKYRQENNQKEDTQDA